MFAQSRKALFQLGTTNKQSDCRPSCDLIGEWNERFVTYGCIGGTTAMEKNGQFVSCKRKNGGLPPSEMKIRLDGADFDSFCYEFQDFNTVFLVKKSAFKSWRLGKHVIIAADGISTALKLQITIWPNE